MKGRKAPCALPGAKTAGFCAHCEQGGRTAGCGRKRLQPAACCLRFAACGQKGAAKASFAGWLRKARRRRSGHASARQGDSVARTTLQTLQGRLERALGSAVLRTGLMQGGSSNGVRDRNRILLESCLVWPPRCARGLRSACDQVSRAGMRLGLAHGFRLALVNLSFQASRCAPLSQHGKRLPHTTWGYARFRWPREKKDALTGGLTMLGMEN